MQKRRALVLGDEAARHPFLRTLPPHVRKERICGAERRKRWRIGYADMRDFLSAYCATFIAVTAFFS